MFRQSSSRNQRSKGFKVKHVLQIFLLLAICIWLLYQVKHSHDKKKAFNGRNGLVSDISEDQTINTYNLGRKDLKPDIPVVVTESESQNEEDEPDEAEEEPKMEDIMEDEGKGAGDDVIDEHDLENENEENEQGKDLEDDEEKESEEKENEDKEENHDTEASDESTQTAREEQYHGDNASSAVLKDTNTEKEDGHGNLINGEEVNRNQDEEQKESENDIRNNGNEDMKSNDNELNNEGDIVEKNNEIPQSNNATVIVVEERETVEIKSNMTSSETNDHIQLPNNLTKADSGDHMEVQSNSTAVKSTDHAEPQGNSTATEPDDQTELKSTMVADELSGLKNSSNPGGTVESLGLSLQNETSAQDENSSVQMETHGEEDHSNSESVDAEHTGGSNTTAAMVGLEGSSPGLTELDDPLVSEVTDARLDLSTLTNVIDEGRSVEDVAAE
ncbi:hypothetical protein QJS04_geneDACA015951 [Acorus gramineus]|uniref:Myb-like protein X n=1 Tax=Acorus gramineus TaxID=55184 RepID=A0AAV9BK52_ACOGR|nr:hypothetical protein QJS04_geneDACA015951 [Acorus gramineus]